MPVGKDRARNLTDHDVNLISAMIEVWVGDPTWAEILSSVHESLGETYTRQALYKHSKIRNALAAKREEILRKKRINTRKMNHEDGEKLSQLEIENVRLRVENDRLIEQFIRWSYNAHTRGMGYEALDQPLPRATSAKRR